MLSKRERARHKNLGLLHAGLNTLVDFGSIGFLSRFEGVLFVQVGSGKGLTETNNRMLVGHGREHVKHLVNRVV